MAIGLIACAAAGAVHASEMPSVMAWPASILALAYGRWVLRRELRRPAREWVFAADGSVRVDGEPVERLGLAWRGPLVFVTWQDAGRRRHRLSWWPDTLPPARRRELRLAVPAGLHADEGKSVAP